MSAQLADHTSTNDMLPPLADLWEVTLEAPEADELSALAWLEDGVSGEWKLRTLKVTPGNRRLVCVFEPGPARV